MGGRPLTAMNIVGMPDDLDLSIVATILRGGAEKILEANCVLAGGHSIRLPEPIYGLSVTGLVHPDRIISNASALPGDFLVLTKPLGTGIATTAIKRSI
jgi:selenide,water dikinase